jgi:hypothetical protein
MSSPAPVYPLLRRGPGAQPTSRHIGGGLEAVLAVADQWRSRPLDDLTGLEAVDALWGTALANLDALPSPRHYPIGPDDEPIAHTIHVLEFDDHFGPSRVLRGTEFFERYLPSSPLGFLIAIPDRHTVLVAPAAAQPAAHIREIASLAADLYDLGPGAISPHVYHLRADDDIVEIGPEETLDRSLRMQ